MPTRTRKPAARKILTFRLFAHDEPSDFGGPPLQYADLRRGNRHIESLCDDWCKILGLKPGEYAVTLKPVAPAKAKTAKKARRRAR